jgi:hypothetical protein
MRWETIPACRVEHVFHAGSLRLAGPIPTPSSHPSHPIPSHREIVEVVGGRERSLGIERPFRRCGDVVRPGAGGHRCCPRIRGDDITAGRATTPRWTRPPLPAGPQLHIADGRPQPSPLATESTGFPPPDIRGRSTRSSRAGWPHSGRPRQVDPVESCWMATFGTSEAGRRCRVGLDGHIREVRSRSAWPSGAELPEWGSWTPVGSPE